MPNPLHRSAPQVLLIGLVLLALGVAAFGITRAFRGSSTPAVKGGVLRWSDEKISDIYTLDPASGLDFNARQAAQLIYSGLVRVDAKSRIVPDAAARWTVSGDGKTYTFYLRPEVRFADGRRLTAGDVAYSLNRTVSKPFAGQSGPYLLGDIEGVAQTAAGKTTTASGIQVVDDNTIRLRLGAPSGSFLAKLATPAGYIVSRRQIAANPRHWTDHAMGTGAFMVQRWVHNSALFLVPNTHYYGGTPELAGVAMPFIPEPLTAYKRYKAGAVDIMGAIEFPTSVLFDVQGDADFHTSPRLETIYLTLNERRAPFKSERVRQAFSRAIDKRALVREAYDNFAHPTDAMVPPGIHGYRTQVPGQYDPALARQLLAQAGYPGGRGFPTVIFPVDQGGQSVLVANKLAEQWHRVLGVTVRPVEYSHSRYLDLLTKLNYQIAVIDWTYDFADPQNFLSQQLHSNVPNNNGGWSDSAFDRLVDRADHMTRNLSTRMALYEHAEVIAIRSAATIPLVNPEAGILVRSNVHGIGVSSGFLQANDWSKVGIGGAR